MQRQKYEVEDAYWSGSIKVLETTLSKTGHSNVQLLTNSEFYTIMHNHLYFKIFLKKQQQQQQQQNNKYTQ